MSTSDPTSVSPVTPEAGNWATASQAREGVAPVILSPSELARMANAMFNALPDDLQQPAIAAARVVLPPNSALSGNTYAVVPGPTTPAVPEIGRASCRERGETFV